MRGIRWVAWSMLVAGWAAACGTESSTFSGFSEDAGTPDGGTGLGPGVFVPTDDASTAEAGVPSALRIEPSTVTITATGPLNSLFGSQSFQAYLQGQTKPVTAIWSVDDASLGSVSTTGFFLSAKTGGTTTVRARVGNLEATATITIKLKIEDNFAGLSDTDKNALRAANTPDGGDFRWLYPYDKTVFPRGLRAPKLMFGGAPPSAYYVHLKSKNVDYEGFYGGGGTAARLTVGDDWWKTVTESAGALDPITISVTKKDGTSFIGPITETWNVAQGSLKGTVFYNTYNSKMVRAASANGAIMRLKPGSDVEVFIGKNTFVSDGTTKTATCTVCHSVNSKGTALAAGLDWSGTAGPSGGGPVDSAVFSIDTAGAATPRFVLSEGQALPFGAFTPDGKWLVGSAVQTGGPNLRGTSGNFPSKLYNAVTGATVGDTFFSGVEDRHFISPTFSPSADRLAFSDRDDDLAGRKLSILSADFTTNPPTFGGKTNLATSVQQVLGKDQVLGWPTFTPDSKVVLFQEGTHFDTAGGRSGAQLAHYCGDLRWVDVASKTTATLDLLNGYSTDSLGNRRCYLPFCDVADPDIDPSQGGAGANVCNTEDAHMNYEPTALPVAVGGFYWVVFTSRRAYGNSLYRGQGSVTSTGDLAFDNSNDANGNLKGYRKKLWVAAIDINGNPGADISHPAFYLEGQEVEAGNMRGFWSLDPCKDTGASCESGNDCCGGYCRDVTSSDGGSGRVCVPPQSGCSQDGEKCTVAAECCNAPAGALCINGFCAAKTPDVVK